VLDGIDAAVEAGLGPVKVNVVLKRGENDGGITELARWARDGGPHPPVHRVHGRGHDQRLAPRRRGAGDAGRRDDRREWPLEAEAPQYPGEVAQRWRYADGRGEIGVIASVTQPFCGDCTRARISAEGKLYTCLFSAVGHDLREPLRSGATDEDLPDLVAGIWGARDDRYSEMRSAATESRLPKIEMFALGG
jgi:cyclic pyranopterin phosphate synthase